MSLSTHKGDLRVTGSLSANTLIPPPSCITDKHVAEGANISASKLEQKVFRILAQGSDVPVSDEKRVVHVATEDGSIDSFSVGCIIANTSGSVEVDLLVNNSSVLVAAVEPGAAYATVAGTISTPAISVGDIIEISIDSTSGDAYGVFGQVVLMEG